VPLMLSLRVLALTLFASLAAALAWQNQAHAVSVGQPCGALAGSVCDKGLWCEPPAGMCASAVGSCVTLPRICVARKNSRSLQPVCGCNGKTYSSDCFRRALQVAKARDGKC
jgi:Kazal-type serine protease inhibitor domain